FSSNAGLLLLVAVVLLAHALRRHIAAAAYKYFLFNGIVFLMDTLYITHPDCGLHNMGSWHPESPDRIDAIHDQLVASGVLDFLVQAIPDPVSDEHILRVHTPEHLNHIKNNAPVEGTYSIDADTIMTTHTLAAARVAAGAGVLAVDRLMQGSHKTAFCSV